MKKKYLIVTANYYKDISKGLLESALKIIPKNNLIRVIKVPGNKTFDNWTVTVINDEEFLIRNAMEKWIGAMGTHEGNIATIGNTFGASGGTLYGQATVQHYSKGGGALSQAEYKFVNIFPVSMGEIALAWDANDAIEEFTVEFAYDYWTHTDVVS